MVISPVGVNPVFAFLPSPCPVAVHQSWESVCVVDFVLSAGLVNGAEGEKPEITPRRAEWGWVGDLQGSLGP